VKERLMMKQKPKEARQVNFVFIIIRQQSQLTFPFDQIIVR